MRLYEFKNNDASIDVIVTTDGCGEQKNVFITTTPTGPGYKVAGTIPERSGSIQTLGFDFVNGTMRKHQDFIDFATKTGLQLIQWNEGLKESSPIILVPLGGLFNYVFTVTSPVSFVKAGEAKALTIVSTKQKIVNGALVGNVTNVSTTGVVTSGQAQFSIAGTTVTAKANAGTTNISGSVELTQAESGKKIVVNLTQLGV